VSDALFVLPDGETARELEVMIPVRGHVKCPASLMEEVDQFRDLLNEHQDKQRWSVHGRLRDRLASVIAGYERIAADALEGASQVRADMLTFLRSVVFVLETIEGDHISHHEKNARIRGAIAVLEKHIGSLRDERFNFSDSVWRRSQDLFRWDGAERRLRDRVKELEAEVTELRQRTASNDD
jgi:hypothetical protein